MKLNPEELEVVSFDMTDAETEAVLATSTCTAFPTPATRCFICPPATSDCIL